MNTSKYNHLTRKELIEKLKEFFDIRELVCPDVFNKFGESSWQFFDRDFLESLLILRVDVICVPMFINNWHRWRNKELDGERFTQRGLRCNICELVASKTKKGILYMTSHANGGGFDFTTAKFSAQECRDKIKAKANMFPCKVRCEKDVTWIHFDIYDNLGTEDMYSEFNG